MRLRSTRLTAIANAIRDKFYGAALNMRFDNTTSLDPRVNFNRTTNATLTNSAGLIANAPMNLLTFSEQFDNAAWAKGNTAVTANTTVAPNGTTTADLAVVTGAGDSINRTATVDSGSIVTFSVFMQRGNHDWFRLTILNGANEIQCWYNLATGVLGTLQTAGTGTSASASMEDAGNGWYRCVISGAIPSTTSYQFINATAAANASFSRVSEGERYIWGAQLELGSTATTYNPTTVKNLLGFTENFDNAAWTKSNSFVQTNLLLRSEEFDNASWGKSGLGVGSVPVVTANFGTAPDGSLTADRMQMALNGGTTSSDRSLISQSSIPIANATQYTGSFYVKATDVSNVGKVILMRHVSGSGYLSVTLTDQWQRFARTETSNSTLGSMLIELRGGEASSDSADFLVWGAQLVQGTTPGDYKATYAAAAAVGYTDIYGQPFAQKLVENTATAEHRLSILGGAILVVASPYVFSVYAKAGERSFMRLMWNGTSTRSAYFNLATGAVGNVGSSATAFIEPVGNGWYRCSIRFDPTGTSATMEVYTSVDGTTTSYTGNGTSGIYIFGAQLSDSASVDPYVYQPVAAPTSTAYYGPRFDYDPVTLAPKGLLIEEQRTNLLLRSEEFDNAAWVKQATGTGVLPVVTANAAVAPDGTMSAEQIVFNKGAGTAVGDQSNIRQAISTTLITSHSIWLRADAPVTIVMRNPVNNGTYFQVNVTTDWQRFVFTDPSAPASASIFEFGLRANVGVIVPNTATVYAWGAQLEAGSFATSYIPTVASQVTRAADNASMIGNNFARWYNQTEGTLFADWGPCRGPASTQNSGVVTVSDTGSFPIVGGSGSNLSIQAFPTSTRSSVVDAGVSQVALNASSVVGFDGAKAALGYKVNDFAFSANGVTALTDTSGTVPVTLDKLGIGIFGSNPGYLNGSVKRIAYYNRRLANTELQAITS